MQTIAVTGALGLIGSTLITALNKLNINVLPIDIRATLTNPVGVNILDYPVLQDIVNNCTGIVHLAAISRVIWGEEDPFLCRQVNVEGTKNIIKACINSPTKPWLIYASSREVYGQQTTFPVSEDCQLVPHNYYAKSKIEAETLVSEAKNAGLQVAKLRFSNVFGGLSDYAQRVVPAFCFNALNNLPLQVYGADSSLDFTYVIDVVKGITQTIEFLSSQAESLPAIHLTTGNATSLLDLAELVLHLCESKAEVIVKPKDTIYPSQFYGDYTRAKSLLGWQPEHTMKSGLTQYLANLKANTAKLHSLNMVSINENFKSHSWLSA